MNEHDAEIIAGILEKLGYVYTSENKEADIILVHTCSVRETAENKVYGLLGRLKKIKEKKPHLIIGVGGCMIQKEATALDMKNRFPYVDLFFGTHNLHELGDLVQEIRQNNISQVVAYHKDHQGIHENLPIKRKQGLKAWVPIAYGCNNFCTYCIVPYVRGRERSRKIEDIVAEIKKLIEDGYLEVTLLGQNVDSYGKEYGISFAYLLRKINEIKGLKRIRFMTSHPKDLSVELIEAIFELDKVCEHIHLPVQAGNNNILKRMNRGYTREDYLDLVSKIKGKIPNVSLTTDVMVGFPGETEKEYEDTMDILQKVCFDGAYTFIYNVRPQTPAAKMPDQVPENVKSRRIQKMVDLQNEITLLYNRKEVGRIHEIMVEGISKNDPKMSTGRTRTNKLVIFPDKNYSLGQVLSVKITEGTLSHLKGEVLEILD